MPGRRPFQTPSTYRNFASAWEYAQSPACIGRKILLVFKVGSGEDTSAAKISSPFVPVRLQAIQTYEPRRRCAWSPRRQTRKHGQIDSRSLNEYECYHLREHARSTERHRPALTLTLVR